MVNEGLSVKELYDLLEPLLDEYGDLEVRVSYDSGLVATDIKHKAPQIVLQPMREYSFDNLTGQDGMSVEELCNIANVLDSKCEELESILELYDCSLNKLEKENKELKLKNEELLYQIGEVGKNNKTCRECECFIREEKYCWMWDMEVEADDVVVACDQRKVKKNTK